MLYGTEALLAPQKRKMPSWGAPMRWRDCCFGLPGGSNQCGEATGFFEDSLASIDETIQDYGFTKTDEGEWNSPTPLQRELGECDMPRNDATTPSGVAEDDWGETSNAGT